MLFRLSYRRMNEVVSRDAFHDLSDLPVLGIGTRPTGYTRYSTTSYASQSALPR